MLSRRTRDLASTTFVIVALALAPLFAQPAVAAPGATLTAAASTLVDTNTGTAYSVGLQANESGAQAGTGDVLLALTGPALSLCTAHGPGIQIDPNTEVGNFPLTSIQCGRAFAMSVSINGCVADITAHGYVHADHPNVTYLGMTTVDIHVDKTAGTASVIVYTPKNTINLAGPMSGSISMSTCP